MNGGPFVPTLTLRYRIGKVTKHIMGKYVAVIERCNPIKKIRLKYESFWGIETKGPRLYIPYTAGYTKSYPNVSLSLGMW